MTVKLLDWLRRNYSEFRFFVERDIVWTCQRRLTELAGEAAMGLRVFNDYPIERGSRRGFSADLVLITPQGRVASALEFKYEPSHRRSDISASKLPVVVWGMDGVAKDIDRARRWTEEGLARHVDTVFIDEGGYFAGRAAHPDSRWEHWSTHTEGELWVLRSTWHQRK